MSLLKNLTQTVQYADQLEAIEITASKRSVPDGTHPGVQYLAAEEDELSQQARIHIWPC